MRAAAVRTARRGVRRRGVTQRGVRRRGATQRGVRRGAVERDGEADGDDT